MSEQSAESNQRSDNYRSQLEADIYWGIGSAAFRDPCELNLHKEFDSPQKNIEDIEDGYLLSLDVKSGDIVTKEIRNGVVIEPETPEVL